VQTVACRRFPARSAHANGTTKLTISQLAFGKIKATISWPERRLATSRTRKTASRGLCLARSGEMDTFALNEKVSTLFVPNIKRYEPDRTQCSIEYFLSITFSGHTDSGHTDSRHTEP
jgi:hypothetical protein